MIPLAQQQQTLLDALFAWPPEVAMKNIAACAIDTRARGLKAYQTNGHMLAERALQAAYPVVAQLLGDESFAALARAFWHAHPPQRGDMNQWGDALPAFLQDSPQLQEDPYVADVARAQWAMHQCAAMADVVPQPGTLSLLTHHDPSHVGLELAPGCAALSSPWPLASLLSAHLYQTPSFQEVGQQLRHKVSQDVLVWRAGLRPMVREAIAGEAMFVHALLNGDSLAAALDNAPLLDFSTWLPSAVHGGLFIRIVEIPV